MRSPCAGAALVRRDREGEGLRTSANTGWWIDWWTGADAGRGNGLRRGVSAWAGTGQGRGWWRGMESKH